MASPIPPPKPEGAGWRGPLGAIFILLGAAGMTTLLGLAYGQTPQIEKAFFSLGLGLPGLLAAITLTLIMGGVHLLWSARRSGPSGYRRKSSKLPRRTAGNQSPSETRPPR